MATRFLVGFAGATSTGSALNRSTEAGARWRTTTAIKGGSDTVKNMIASLGGKAGEAAKHVSLGMVAVEIASHVFEHGDLHTAAWAGAGAVAAHMGNALRSAGIKRTSDLYMAALADPELARTLVSKMPASVNNGTMLAFSRALKRSLILGPMAVE